MLIWLYMLSHHDVNGSLFYKTMEIENGKFSWLYLVYYYRDKLK